MQSFRGSLTDRWRLTHTDTRLGVFILWISIIKKTSKPVSACVSYVSDELGWFRLIQENLSSHDGGQATLIIKTAWNISARNHANPAIAILSSININLTMSYGQKVPTRKLIKHLWMLAHNMTRNALHAMSLAMITKAASKHLKKHHIW